MTAMILLTPACVDGACAAVSDGRPNVPNDVLGLLNKFANINALEKARAANEPGDDGINNGPDLKVNISRDCLFILDAFRGFPYPFIPGDPSDVDRSAGTVPRLERQSDMGR